MQLEINSIQPFNIQVCTKVSLFVKYNVYNVLNVSYESQIKFFPRVVLCYIR